MLAARIYYALFSAVLSAKNMEYVWGREYHQLGATAYGKIGFRTIASRTYDL
jgi:hypothetical protein